MKVGDYETAEFALKEFIDKNKDHDLAGNAQYCMERHLEFDSFIQTPRQLILTVIKIILKAKKLDNLLKLGIPWFN